MSIDAGGPGIHVNDDTAFSRGQQRTGPESVQRRLNWRFRQKPEFTTVKRIPSNKYSLKLLQLSGNHIDLAINKDAIAAHHTIIGAGTVVPARPCAPAQSHGRLDRRIGRGVAELWTS